MTSILNRPLVRLALSAGFLDATTWRAPQPRLPALWIGRVARPRGGGRSVKLGPVTPSAPPEEALVERAKAGDPAAFEELVRRHADRLHAIVLRFVADRDEAQEVTQEAFLRAWRSIGRFEGRSQFFTWLYRIGINEAKRRAGRRPPAALVSLDDEPIPEAPGWSQAPETRMAQADLRRVLEDAIRALPIEYRKPIVLRDLEGLTTREAAEVMELGEAAFKSRLHRARLAVRRALDEYFLEVEQ